MQLPKFVISLKETKYMYMEIFAKLLLHLIFGASSVRHIKIAPDLSNVITIEKITNVDHRIPNLEAYVFPIN